MVQKFNPQQRAMHARLAAHSRWAQQDPVEGTAPRGSSVELQVSKGPERIVVPDVEGQARADAEAALEALGLEVDVQAIPGPGTVRTQKTA